MTTNIPDTLPTLDSGSHPEGAHKLCIMEAVSWLAGEKHSDHPECVMPAIARVAIWVNDTVDAGIRQTLWPFGLRCLGTATDDLMIHRRLALWCAERVLPIFEARRPGDGRVRACIDVTRRYLDGKAAIEELRDAAYAASAAYAYAYAASASAASAYAYAASASASAAYAHAAVAADAAAAYAAAAADAAAADAAAAAADAAKVQFLTEMLDEYDRLTGRTESPQPSAEAWNRVMEFAQ